MSLELFVLNLIQLVLYKLLIKQHHIIGKLNL